SLLMVFLSFASMRESARNQRGRDVGRNLIFVAVPPNAEGGRILSGPRAACSCCCDRLGDGLWFTRKAEFDHGLRGEPNIRTADLTGCCARQPCLGSEVSLEYFR